jgi:hypothetical protein
MAYSKAKLKSSGDKASPCFRPFSMLNLSDRFLPIRTILKSKYITWHSKIRLYKTVIRPVIACGSEAWVMNKYDENMINVFERKILGKIFGAVREGDHWRVRYNNELYGSYREQDLVSYIKVGRM